MNTYRTYVDLVRALVDKNAPKGRKRLLIYFFKYNNIIEGLRRRIQPFLYE